MFKRYVYSEGFTSLIDSDNDFNIDVHGNVRNYKKELIVPVKDADGHLTVTVFSWNGQRDYRVIDLVAIHFKDLHIPRRYYNDVVAFVLDGNKENTHAKNVGYRFREKIESKKFPGFYYIPAFTRCVINENGDVYQNDSLKKKTWTPTKPGIRNSKGGYFTSKYHADGVAYSFLRHRALCLTFKEYPDSVDTLTVNHIDGVPGHDQLDNLEWATRGWNNTHAYISDLKQQHKRVLSRDVLTGKVTEYYSISECARIVGLACDEAIRYRLYNSKFGTVFEDGKQFKFKDDKRDWIIPTDPLKAIEQAQEWTAVIMKNCKTGEEMTYPSIVEAGRRSGIKSSTINWRLKNYNKKPLMGYQVKKLTDNESFPSFTSKELEDSFIPSALFVECRNLLTGERREYDSVNQASKDLDKFTIAPFLREGEQALYADGWQVKFKDETWEEIDDFEEVLYKRTKDITAKCEKTGDLILAENSAQLGKILGKDPKAIRMAAMTRGHKVYHGFRFRLGVSDEPWPVE